MKQYKLKRNLVRLYQLIFDSSAIIALVVGFAVGSLLTIHSVVETLTGLDKTGIDMCVRSGELGSSPSRHSPSVAGEGGNQ
jgi:hypothetical protein